MVKSNFSLGTVLLTIVLTIVIFIGAIAGTLIAVYKTVKVSTITGLFGDTEWISSEYDGTIEEVVKKVSDALSGEINIDTLTEISPAAGDFADQLVDNIENNGLFKVDRELLYSTNFSQLTANLTEMLVITASLNDLSEQFSFDLPDLDIITGSAESPLLVYTQVNDNEAGTIDKVFDGKYAAQPYTFYTRAESFVSVYTDDAGAKRPITEKTAETLYKLEGVDTQSGYLKRSTDGATLYLQTEYKTENGGTAHVRVPMTKNNGAVYAVNGNDITFALAANEKIVTRTGPDDETDYTAVDLGASQGETTTYTAAAPYRYKPLYTEKAQAPEGGNPMGDTPKTGDYYEANGKYYVLATETDGSGNYVADTENGGFAVAEDYTAETLFALEYVYTEADAAAANADTALYVETDGIGGLPVTYALTAFSRVFDMDEMTLADVGTYFGVDLSNDMLDAVRYVPMGYLSDSMNAEMSGIYVKDVLDITPDSSALLRTLAYGEEGVDYRIEGEEFVMIGNAKPKTIADLTLGLDELKISSVVDIVTDEEAEDSGGTLTASHPLMQAIADWTLTDFSELGKNQLADHRRRNNHRDRRRGDRRQSRLAQNFAAFGGRAARRDQRRHRRLYPRRDSRRRSNERRLPRAFEKFHAQLAVERPEKPDRAADVCRQHLRLPRCGAIGYDDRTGDVRTPAGAVQPDQRRPQRAVVRVCDRQNHDVRGICGGLQNGG